MFEGGKWISFASFSFMSPDEECVPSMTHEYRIISTTLGYEALVRCVNEHSRPAHLLNSSG